MIKDYQLMGIVCILVGLDVLVLTVWEFTDPLKIVRYNKTLEIIVSVYCSMLPLHLHFHLGVHVNDLDLTTQILVSTCHTCPVYAINEFGFPSKFLSHLWIFLWVLKGFFLNLRWVLKLLRTIYRTGLSWKNQNLGHKVEVKYMNEPFNAC